LVLIPLNGAGRGEGAFLVDYGRFADGLWARRRGFFDERLAIIQGNRHQTAVAVENIRLIKSQKENPIFRLALLHSPRRWSDIYRFDEALGRSSALPDPGWRPARDHFPMG